MSSKDKNEDSDSSKGFHVIIFDGDCGFCEASKDFLLKLDWAGRLRFRPYQDPNVFVDYPRLSPVECEASLQFISKSGKIYSGGDGFLKMCFQLPVVAPLALLFWLFPLRYVVRIGYRWVARKRGHISAFFGL